MIFIAILAHHSTFSYYAYKSKLYFLRNAMMIFCSIDSSPHTHTHTRIYKEKKYNIFLVNLSRLWLHTASRTSWRQIKIYRAAHISSYIHILNITYTSHTIIRKYNLHIHMRAHTHTHTHTNKHETHTHTHTHTHTQTVVHNPNVLLTVYFFFDFFRIFCSLPDDCRP